MDLLLIRHGQTNGNLTHRHQPEHGRLTAIGREQATALAEQVASFQPTYFISSTHVRALETAAIISHDMDMIPSTSALFAELHRPHYMYGQFHRSLHTVTYLLGWFVGFIGSTDNIDEKGESYRVFQERVAQAATVLTAQPTDARVVVVTHAVFMAFLLHHLTAGRHVWPWQLPTLIKNIFTIKNGSALRLNYNADTGRWQRATSELASQ